MLTVLTNPDLLLFIGAAFCTLVGYGLCALLNAREFAAAEEWREAYDLAVSVRYKLAERLARISHHPIKPGTNGTAHLLQRIARGEEQ
jgi:hypothetical protein